MSGTVDIDPYTLDRLVRAAKASGKALGQFVEDAVHDTSSRSVWFKAGLDSNFFAPGLGRLAAGRTIGMSGQFAEAGIAHHASRNIHCYESVSREGYPCLVFSGEAHAQPAPIPSHMDDESAAYSSAFVDSPFQSLQLAGGERIELSLLAHFTQRIFLASIYLSAAFAMAEVPDFKPTRRAPVFRPRKYDCGWYASVVNAGFNRFWELRNALVHTWTPSAEGEPLTLRAFALLAELVPAHGSLMRLYALDPAKAFQELARHLDVLAEQIKLSVKLVADLEEAETKEEAVANEERLDTIQDAILLDVGETLALSAAADRLGVTRQNLHKRIQRGSAIGVMRQGEILVPAAQFVEENGKTKIVEGLQSVIAPFLKSGAGHWSALQFLVETEPNLAQPPLEALKSGVLPAVVARAGEAYLGLDEQDDTGADDG